MRMMVDLKSERGAVQLIDGATSVECHQDHVGCWKPLRYLMEFMIPRCGCQSVNNNNNHNNNNGHNSSDEHDHSAKSTITGTMFGHKKGRVSFCIQRDPRSPPLVLLEFAIPTYVLAKEMRHGLLRIALECEKQTGGSLLAVPVWTMYCNGRKVGFAMKRHPTENDGSILKAMRCIFVGAGRIARRAGGIKGDSDEGDVMYMRATYKRAIGSSDSQSFHLINPDGSTRQELSIFLLRSP